MGERQLNMENCKMDTRDIRISVEHLKMLNMALMIQPDEFFQKWPEYVELLDMMLDAVNNSDSETLNDFTA
jgi:hypothetical protein